MLDSFKAHTADSVSEELEKVKSDIAVIPGGCTSKIQPLDVCINRPFKDSLRKSWVDYMYAHAPSGATLATIPKPSKQQVVDWVVSEALASDPDDDEDPFEEDDADPFEELD